MKRMTSRLAFCTSSTTPLRRFLEFPAKLGARQQRGHIQGYDAFFANLLRDISTYDALRQSFDNGCLADARLAHEYRVILRTPTRVSV